MENELILITKVDCQKCDWLKNKLEKESIEIETHDAKSVDGMVHLAFHGLLDDDVHMPVLLINDDRHIAGKTLEMLKEIRQNNGAKV